MALSPIALAATFTGIGVVILGLIIGLVTLILRDRQKHKRMLADLEEREVEIAQSQQNEGRATVSKPRAALRRNMILPFNTKSGWGTLSSVETLNLTEIGSRPQHYVPPKPVGVVSKSKRLSWPFTGRRTSGKAIHMRKIRVPVLSTVIESPKPSPMVPVLSGSLGGESSPPRKSLSRPSSDQSLLQRHPAFRDMGPIAEFGIPHKREQSGSLRRSLAAKAISKTEHHVGPNRSTSVTEAPGSNRPGVMSRGRPRSHARSTSQSSGSAPGSELPPLPLEVARVKDLARKRSLLSRSPSRMSISSYESAGSSILAAQSSPVMRSPNSRVQKVTKRQWRNSTVIGPRPMRDTVRLHERNQHSLDSIKSSAARYSMAISAAQGGNRNSVLTNSSSLQSVGKVGTAESVTLNKILSPPCSPLTLRSMATPKRKSESYVTPYGSPGERRKRSSMLHNAPGNLTRELSQASTQASSTRSSNGNPFQWDPSPMSVGKASNLKGSPSARNKGHKRQNCVRISLTPTVHWPRSRSSSPAAMKEIVEESANTAFAQNICLGFSDKLSLPRPPSTSTFAPDLKITTTSIQASLTPNSPTLSMADYDHGPVGSPVVTQNYYVPSGSPQQHQKNLRRMSTTSMFSIPKFPSPGHNFPSNREMTSPPPTFAIHLPSDEQEDDYWKLDGPTGASSSFEMLLEIHSSPDRPSPPDEYDPEQPSLVFQTPPKDPIRNFSSPFSTILEESSTQSKRTVTYENNRHDDSPPCSPKTIPQEFPVDQTVFPEVSLDTIDPAMLSKEAFYSLNKPFDKKNGSIIEAPNSTRSSVLVPTSPRSAQSTFAPLLEAAFPSSPPTAREFPLAGSTRCEPSDTQAGHQQSGRSSPYSMYSLPSPTSLSPTSPCSPRPAHAQLPAPSLNFAAMPTLTPSLCVPSGSPPGHLRTSIQTLRRMNSAAETGRREERRYLRLGRQDSPSEVSWLDELEGSGDDVDAGAEEEDDSTWDEEKGQKLIGDILNDGEEEEDVTVLGLQDATPIATPTVSSPARITSFTAHKSSADDLDLWNDSPNGLPIRSSSKPGTPTANRDRSSSIWDDGEKFWCSTPPHPPAAVTSPNKPKQRFMPLSSSPVTASAPINTTTPKLTKKRDFEVAKDGSPAKEDSEENANGKNRAKNWESPTRTPRRKRSALGVSTPNVQIHIHPPSSGGMETSGNLYDAEGFLR